MSKIISNQYLLFVFRVFLAYIFLYAGIQKITSPADFALAISNYRLIPIQFVNLLALMIPWIEVVAGLLLLFGISVKENSFILTTLLGIFIIAIIISLIRGLDISCGCFGTKSGAQIGFMKVLENTGLFLIGIILIISGSEKFSLNTITN